MATAIKMVNWVDRRRVVRNASSYMRVIARAVRRKLKEAQKPVPFRSSCESEEATKVL